MKFRLHFLVGFAVATGLASKLLPLSWGAWVCLAMWLPTVVFTMFVTLLWKLASLPQKLGLLGGAWLLEYLVEIVIWLMQNETRFADITGWKAGAFLFLFKIGTTYCAFVLAYTGLQLYRRRKPQVS